MFNQLILRNGFCAANTEFESSNQSYDLELRTRKMRPCTGVIFCFSSINCGFGVWDQLMSTPLEVVDKCNFNVEICSNLAAIKRPESFSPILGVSILCN